MDEWSKKWANALICAEREWQAPNLLDSVAVWIADLETDPEVIRSEDAVFFKKMRSEARG